MERDEVIRRVCNPFEKRSTVDVITRIECYSFKEIINYEAQYMNISRDVRIIAYGICVEEIVIIGETKIVKNHEYRSLSAKHYEVSYLLNVITRLPAPTIDKINCLITTEVTTWDDSFKKAALKKLKVELGMYSYNPFNKPTFMNKR